MGTTIPAARNAATPQAVACFEPCRLACANTPIEIRDASASARRNVTGLSLATALRSQVPSRREWTQSAHTGRRCPPGGRATGAELRRLAHPRELAVRARRRRERARRGFHEPGRDPGSDDEQPGADVETHPEAVVEGRPADGASRMVAREAARRRCGDRAHGGEADRPADLAARVDQARRDPGVLPLDARE